MTAQKWRNYTKGSRARQGGKTLGGCYAACARLQVGTEATVKKMLETGGGDTRRPGAVPAVVTERYSNFLVVRYANGIKEAFTYKDIALRGLVSPKAGRGRGDTE